MELGLHQTGGLCGAFYRSNFACAIMLQMGGGFSADWGDPDVVAMECIDRTNAVTLELRRHRDLKAR